MKKRVLVLGGAGYGEVVASVVEKIPDMELVGFVNDFFEVGSTIGNFRKIPVVCNTESVFDRVKQNSNLYLISGYNGITDPWKSYARLQQLEKCIPSERWVNVIDPSAQIPYEYCSFGKGIFIGPLAQVCTNVRLGDHCAIMGGAFVGHDCTIGEFAHLTANSVIIANVHVGKCVLVGPNSTVRGEVVLGDASIVGLGSTVLYDVDEGCVVAGNPAKFLKERKDCFYGVGMPQYVDMSTLNIDG